MRPSITQCAIVLAMAGLSFGAQAQTAAQTEAVQVVNLSASAYQEAAHDRLRVVLRTTVEGADAMAVQKQLKQAVDAALTQLKPHTQPRQLEVRSGVFGVQPRYGDKGRVAGWQGRADLVIEGRDFAKIGQVAGEVPRMAVESAQFSLSREARQRLEAEVQSQAVQNFRQKALQLAKDFGFAGYTLRQVTVGMVDRPAPVVPMVGMARTAMPDAVHSPVPLEGGKDELQITVSGSVQLR
ncbi:MAG: hypothetical protein RL559_732 [Pseudomonadota bacterium]